MERHLAASRAKSDSLGIPKRVVVRRENQSLECFHSGFKRHDPSPKSSRAKRRCVLADVGADIHHHVYAKLTQQPDPFWLRS